MNPRNFYYDFLTVLGVLIGKTPLCGPRIAQLNISDECNLNCIMCNRACIGVKGFFDYERAVCTIEELYAMGLREIYFHGYGEPFLHPRIADLFRFVRSNYPNLKQFVVTNGTCISDEMIGVIKENSVGVRFSVHAGDQKIWQQIHPEDDPSLFWKIKHTLIALTKDRTCQVELLFVLFETNWNTIDSMIRFALETGAPKVIFRPMRFFPDKTGRVMNGHLMLTDEHYQTLSRKLTQVRKTCGKKLTINSMPFLESSYDTELGRPSSFDYYGNNSCYIGWVLTLILSDGQVLGCLEESFPGSMGNVHEMHFKEIWWSKPYHEFRKCQLFTDKKNLDKTACLSWCQHLGLNRKLNDLKKLRVTSVLRGLLSK